MVRSQSAPLSPNEEKILRHVALGTATEFTVADLRRLTAFELVESVAGQLKLTPAGQTRLKELRTSDTRGHDDAVYGQAGKTLSQFYGRARQTEA